MEAMRRIQKAWDTPMAAKILTDDSNTRPDTARLGASATPHAGDWLHAPPITAVGLRLSDEANRIAVGFRLGSQSCQPHSCVCGAMVDAKGFHGLSCNRSAPRPIRHAQMNDISQESAVTGCQGTGWFVTVGRKKTRWGNDDPMDERKRLAWDVTISDTFSNSYIGETSTRATAAADRAAENKTTKYTDLAKTHHFVTIAFETGGAWNELASISSRS